MDPGHGEVPTLNAEEPRGCSSCERRRKGPPTSLRLQQSVATLAGGRNMLFGWRHDDYCFGWRQYNALTGGGSCRLRSLFM
jgi:hypothetical protein